MFNKKNIYLLSQNVISLFIVKGIDLVLTLLLIPFLILKVGISNYGIYAFAMALMLFFVNVLNYGFDLSAVRELAIYKEDSTKISEIVSKVISVKLFLITILYFIVFGLIFFIPQFLEYKKMYLFASLVLVGDLFSVRWFFIGLEKMKFISIMSTLATTIYVLVAIGIIKIKSDYIYIPLAEAIGMFLISLSSIFWVIRVYKVQFRLLSLNEIFLYLRLNFSSFVSLLLPSTYGVTCVFLVGVFGLPLDVTIMQVGMKFTSAFSTANTILTTVFYPMVNREKRNMQATRLILLAVGFLLSLVMFFGSDFFILHWLKFENSSYLMNTIQLVKILSPIPFLMGVISSYGINGLLVYLKDKEYGGITIMASLIMIFSAVYFIPIYHFLGGALAFLLGRFLYALVLFLVFNKIKMDLVAK